ncbi:MAG: hypothetical protein ACLQU4_16055, partial [Limisphaerales bacterium]
PRAPEYLRDNLTTFSRLESKVMQMTVGADSQFACPPACPLKPQRRWRGCRADLSHQNPSTSGTTAEVLGTKAASNPTQSESHRVAPNRSDFNEDAALIPTADDRMFPLILAFPEESDNTMKHENCVLDRFSTFQPEQAACQRVPTERHPGASWRFVLIRAKSC